MKHTLIIGGTRGMGRALVKAFAAGGGSVSVVGRRPPVESDARIPHVKHWTVDLLDVEGLSRALVEIVRKSGKLNSLIFCQRYRGGQEDAWHGELQTSLTSTKNIVERVVDSFDKRGDRSIVAIGSVASQFIAEEQPAAYHVAKAGLTHMVRYYAVVLGPKGIRVNCVSPSTVLKEESKRFYLQHPELMALYNQITPLGRMGAAAEIASVVEFLCSSKASFITGQNIVVDGGLSLQWHESLARKLASLTHLPVTQQTPKSK